MKLDMIRKSAGMPVTVKKPKMLRREIVDVAYDEKMPKLYREINHTTNKTTSKKAPKVSTPEFDRFESGIISPPPESISV